MSSIIQVRRDTAANWTSVNPVLAQGEKGYETDSIGSSEAKYKIGDGLSDWVSLDYQGTGGGAVDSVNGETGIVVLDTSDISDTTDKRYSTDAEKTVLGNTSGINTGDQDISGISTNATAIALNTSKVGYTEALVSGNTDVVANTSKVGLTAAQTTKLANTTNTNTGDQDLSSLQPILSEGAFVDGDKTNLDNQSGTNTGDQDISAKIEADDYAVYNTGGTVKMSRNTATSRTYVSFDGSDTPDVT